MEMLLLHVDLSSVLAFVLLPWQDTAFPTINDGSSTGKSRWSRDHVCPRSPKLVDWQSLRDCPIRIASPKTSLRSMVEPFQCFIRRRFVPIWCPTGYPIRAQDSERPVWERCLNQERAIKPCSLLPIYKAILGHIRGYRHGPYIESYYPLNVIP